MKPPYRVPSMAEINALPVNGLRVAELFAGGGGSSTGWRMAGFHVVYANEFVPAAADTYRANSAPDTIVDERDIRGVTGQDILTQIGCAVGDLDVLSGSPPCSSFSTAGKRSAKWGTVNVYSDTQQRTDDLFYEYARLIKDIQPRVFVAENVSGLVKGVSKGYFKAILAAMQGCGYRVSARLLNAAWLGVPQSRQRLIFVGVRNDMNRAPVHPKPLLYQYTVRDALPWITRQDTGMVAYQDRTPLSVNRPARTILAAGGDGFNQQGIIDPRIVSSTRNPAAGQPRGQQEHSIDAPAPTVMAFGIGGGRRHQTAVIHDTGGQPYSRGDITRPSAAVMTTSSHFQVVHERGQSWNGKGDITGPPAPTVTVGVNSVNSYHYQVRVGEAGEFLDPETGQNLVIPTSSTKGKVARKFTLEELRAICAFPPDYVLTGTYANRWERIGRSVPPVMMQHIATTVRDRIILCAD